MVDLVKICKRCHTEKSLSFFRADTRYRDGVGSWCCDCHRERNSAWAKENRERLTIKSAVFRQENIEKSREINRNFKSRNKARLAIEHKDWAKNNRHKRNATTAKRNSSKLHATPLWADFDAISQIYREASRIQLETGVKMHVDHIVPLQHPLVCGLHCVANLQILTATENIAKKNYWWPDMFIETKPAPAKQEALL